MAWFFSKPFLSLGRFLFKTTGLPIYRLVLFGHRQFSRVYNPAKNRFLFLFTNRYVFHAAIVTIAAVTSVVNIQASEVRAETYGSKSLLMGLVDQEGMGTIEEVSAGQIVTFSTSKYLDTYTFSSEEIESAVLYEDQVATLMGEEAIVSPTISSTEAGSAPRTTVETYVVKEGDVLGSIAGAYGLNLNSLLWANNLTVRSTIKPGQSLTIPPTNGVLYAVKSGDTLSSIANKYSTTTDKILSFNSLSSSSALQIGQKLMLPDATPPTATPVTYTAPAASVFTGTKGSTAPAAATGSWVWPTDGCYITVYFHQYYIYGLHTGLDIDGDYTSNVYATKSGTITRASWFDGYGNCIDINHGGGYSSRYGHLSKFFVSAGDYVEAGQVIGKVGTTGRSTGTHLHFEIMENSAKLNPLNFIRCK